MIASNEAVLVTVIIPCYNSMNYIGQCVESVFSQSYENIEVIVVDDGSTDKSLEVLQNYKNLKVISQANSGACIARNKGLKAASGKYIKFLDSDDFLEPDIIKRQVDLAESLGEHTIVYGDYYIYRDGRKIYQSTFIEEGQQTALLMVRDILIATPLHRKWMLEAVDGFDERFKSGQEWNLHVRLSSEGFLFQHHDVPVFNYRIHGSEGRISNSGGKEKENIEYSLKKTMMTRERLGSAYSGDINAAIAMRYWWAARGFYRLGERKKSRACIKKAKNVSRNYSYYWPLYYRVAYSIFGFRVTECAFKVLIATKKKKYT